MANYDFSTLNDKDLEVLVCDLLTREYSINFQSFKVGKDKGIDLRYSTNSSENEIIVQVKHYLKSGYNQLLNVLKKSEKSKIDSLAPKRYILVTSIGLSPTDKEKIKTALSPHIQNTNDIIGCDDLNSLLSKHEDLETKHFKLWFSNINIIQKIVYNGIDGRSTFIAEKIKKNIGLYVVNNSYDEALAKLRKHKVLLITGIPGIGKTTLANLITYRLLSKDFRLVYIDGQIREAEDMFDADINVKQLFFFDDFLGSNYLEIINSRNTDKTIVNFIERIKATPNKYLILTTRTTILNQARSQYDKLKRANLDTLKYEIEISKYDLYDKAKILYNHLYFNDLPYELIIELFEERKYFDVIKHRNYNPRLIEFFTLEHNISHLKLKEYFNFISYHLENPEEIWDSAITNQLGEDEKYLLFSLLTLGRNVNREHLEIAFDERIGHEVIKYGFTRRVNIFNISFKNLLDGYITNAFYSQYSQTSYVNYVNPSLRDYLISFFNKNNSEKWRLIESFIYIEQFVKVFSKKDISRNYVFIELIEVRKFLEIANSKRLKSIYVNDLNNLYLRYAYLFSQYRDIGNEEYIDNLIIEKIRQIDWENLIIIFFNDLLPIIEFAEESSELFGFFKGNWNAIISKLISVVEQEIELERIKELFKKYNIQYDHYIQEEIWIKKIYAAIDKIYESEAKEIIEQEQNDIFKHSDFEKMGNMVIDKYHELTSKFLDSTDFSPSVDPLKEIDSTTLIEVNNRAHEEAESHQDDWRENDYNMINNESLIEDLFSTFEK